MKKWIGIVVILALITVVAWSAFNKKESSYGVTSEGTGLEKGDTPPQFTLQTLDGKEISLAQLKGKKVILNFWATWCDPCREEMPVFEQFDQEREDVVVVAVNMTHKDSSKEKIEAFAKEFGLTFSIPLDEIGDVSKAYEVVNIPSTYFIDAQGVLQMRINGAVDDTMLNLYVEKL